MVSTDDSVKRQISENFTDSDLESIQNLGIYLENANFVFT